MKELKDYEKIELEIEKINQRIRNWQRKAEVMGIDSSLSNSIIDDMLEELSLLMKKGDYLKK